MRIINNPYKKTIIFFIILIHIGLFLPWFYFERSLDYTVGYNWLSSPLLSLGIVGSIGFLFNKEHSKLVYVFHFLSFLLIIFGCVYLFFTWHYLTITGEISFSTSLRTTHFGFYITFVSAMIASALSGMNIRKKQTV